MKLYVAATMSAAFAFGASVNAEPQSKPENAEVIKESASSNTADNGATKNDAPNTEIATNDAANLDEMVCRRFAVTGTRVKKKVCLTQAQWIAVEEAGERNAREIQDAGAINTTPDFGS